MDFNDHVEQNVHLFVDKLAYTTSRIQGQAQVQVQCKQASKHEASEQKNKRGDSPVSEFVLKRTLL